jgi:hypothetical protein
MLHASSLPRFLRQLANEAGVAGGRASPNGRLGTYTSKPHERRPRRPCHYRAIHTGHGRSRADNHGQRHTDRDLRRSLCPQIAILPDLALQAGGRRFESGGPHHQLWLPS